MADERMAVRDPDWTKSFSWLRIFQTFLVALDPFKLLVAAAGILTTAVGWFLISALFYNTVFPSKPKLADFDPKAYQTEGMPDEEALKRRDSDYSRRLNAWKLRYKLAGPTRADEKSRFEEFETVDGRKASIAGGKYRVMPWFEDRGPNPVTLVKNTVTGNRTERHETIGSFLMGQIFVLVEPLLKFLTPIGYMFDTQADTWTRLYLVILLVWELAVWAFFGGVITRMAISTLAGKETGGLRGAIGFVKKNYLSYLASPIIPVAGLFAIVIGCMVFGLLHLIPGLGDLIDGFGWFIPLGAGFLMTLVVLGLVGYPLMYTTLSAEGSDTFDALSRSYNYVYESPWSYFWYSLVAVLYGAILVFFVVIVTSLTVYLANWGVGQTFLTQTVNREPHYLYTYAPTSFGWRQLLLEGTPLETYGDSYANPAAAEHYVQEYTITNRIGAGRQLVLEGRPLESYGNSYVNPAAAEHYLQEYTFTNRIGAGLVSVWLTLVFMLMLGFSYSYFWTASSMIYLLMRKKVDETELDEIHIDDDDFEPQGTKPTLAPAPSAPPSPPATLPVHTQMVDPPTLRAVPLETPKPVDILPPTIKPETPPSA